jgi:hypothetical protein
VCVYLLQQEISLLGCAGLTSVEVNCWQLSRLLLGPSAAKSTGNTALTRLALTSEAMTGLDCVSCK